MAQLNQTRIAIKIFEAGLPVWETQSAVHGQARLDNNYFSPAFASATKQLELLEKSGGVSLVKLSQMVPEKGGIVPGKSPEKERADSSKLSFPVIEGSNLRPNYVLPVFTKTANSNARRRIDLESGDLLLGKDGEPGVVSVGTPELSTYCRSLGAYALSASSHVYRIRLKTHYADLTYYVCAFFNSKVGQAIVRRYISGGTTPTLRGQDVQEFLVPIPRTRRAELAQTFREELEELQKRIISSSLPLVPSQKLIQTLNMQDPDERLPINFVGGGRSDPHGYY